MSVFTLGFPLKGAGRGRWKQVGQGLCCGHPPQAEATRGTLKAAVWEPDPGISIIGLAGSNVGSWLLEGTRSSAKKVHTQCDLVSPR